MLLYCDSLAPHFVMAVWFQFSHRYVKDTVCHDQIASDTNRSTLLLFEGLMKIISPVCSAYMYSVILYSPPTVDYECMC